MTQRKIKIRVLTTLTLISFVIAVGAILNQWSWIKRREELFPVILPQECPNHEWVANVNGDLISCRDFNNATRDYALQQTLTDSIQKVLLNNLIDVELLFQEAKRLDVKLNESAGKLRVHLIKQAHGSDSLFIQKLNNSGLTEVEYEQLWQKQAYIDQYIFEQIESRIQVHPSVLEKLYERLSNDTIQPLLVPYAQAEATLRTLYIKEKVKMILQEKVNQLKKSARIEFRKG